MGMGNYPCYADTVEESFVQEVCPDELKKFEVVLFEGELSKELFANVAQFDCDIAGEIEIDMGYNGDDIDIKAQEIVNAYDTLRNKFHTETGLELNIMHHNKEDRGDEVDGVFWSVEGVYVLSDAGKKYEDKIERKGWTVYG